MTIPDPVLAARALTRDVLIPQAEQVDVDGVRRELLGGADGATWFVSAQHTLLSRS